jgi:hypothetical protein
MVGDEAGRPDVLPRDRRRGGQAGMGQVGRRDGRRADEGAPCVGPCALGPVRGSFWGRRGRLADRWPQVGCLWWSECV